MEPAKLTISVAEVEGTPGLLASLKTEGAFAAEVIDRRFYSIAEQPPADLPPQLFWATLLGLIGRFLEQDPGDESWDPPSTRTCPDCDAPLSGGDTYCRQHR